LMAMIDDIKQLVASNAALPADLFNAFTLDLEMTPRNNWFSPGSFPTLSLKNGALPNAVFSKGTAPSASLKGGSLPSATFANGTLPSANFSAGEAPSLSVSYTTVVGVSVPTSLTFDPGALPSFTFNKG